jgi:AraC-like DNA-binding protein
MTNNQSIGGKSDYETFLSSVNGETRMQIEHLTQGRGNGKIVFFVIEKSSDELKIKALTALDPGNQTSTVGQFKPAETTFSLARGGLPKLKLQRVLAFIAENIEEEITLDDMAKIARMSVCYFARMFKQSVGTSPYQFVLEQRIDYGKYLLTQTDLPLVEIALRCGCANQSHFTTVFKQLLGVTPKRYRDWHQTPTSTVLEKAAFRSSTKLI